MECVRSFTLFLSLSLCAYANEALFHLPSLAYAIRYRYVYCAQCTHKESVPLQPQPAPVAILT